jgi:hypothetical protein
MAKYRKKPVEPIEIEAEQWFPGRHVPGVRLVPQHDVPSRAGGISFTVPENYFCDTLRGPEPVSPGDWVIQDIDLWYVCKDEMFRANYEPADDEAEQSFKG